MKNLAVILVIVGALFGALVFWVPMLIGLHRVVPSVRTPTVTPSVTPQPQATILVQTILVKFTFTPTATNTPSVTPVAVPTAALTPPVML